MMNPCVVNKYGSVNHGTVNIESDQDVDQSPELEDCYLRSHEYKPQCVTVT